jgi:hypothetical protein
MESLALGAQQLSAWLDLNLQPHRCRIMDLRSSLVVLVRRVVFVYLSCFDFCFFLALVSLLK